jgi:hypothetical protein
MSDNLYRLGTDTQEEFFARIDMMGGWPLGYKFVTQQHTTMTERPCYFGNQQIRNEMNTTIFSADDYYWWKLTAERKAQERLKTRKEFALEITRELE